MAIKRDLEHFLESKKWEQKSASSSTIFRVGPRQRKMKPEHFQHEFISLGLYDRSTSSSEASTPKTEGDTFRLAIVSAFLFDMHKTVDDWDGICAEVVKNPVEMMQIYNEYRDDLPAEEVRSILALDAIFLACCLGTTYRRGFRSQFPSVSNIFIRERTIFWQILHEDITKLENQIPLSLIGNAFSIKTLEKQRPQTSPLPMQRLALTAHRTPHSVDLSPLLETSDQILEDVCTKMVDDYRRLLPGFRGSDSSVKYELSFQQDCTHLLDCLYKGAMHIPCTTQIAPEKHPTLQRLYGSLASVRQISLIATTVQPASAATAQPVAYTEQGAAVLFEVPLPSASQLVKAGIEFRGRSGRSFSEVEFKVLRFTDKAILFLPIIDFLGDDCEPLWRNLVAYEDETSKYDEFKAYLTLMDDLIDSKNDVAILRTGKHPVIVRNGLGSDVAVAEVFNSVLSQYGSKEMSPPWNELRNQVHNHYNNGTRRRRVEFFTTYFGRWWLTASLLAAIVLLFLSVLQTIYSILSYYES